MGFLYTPITQQEAIEERYQLLKEGIYDAVILESKDRISNNSGNPMMDMTLQVFDEQGRSKTVRDFLVFTRSMMWKVINFAQSSNLMKEYEEGKLCSEMVVNARIRVKIVIEQGSLIPEDKLNGKAAGARYPDKNKVDDYISLQEENNHQTTVKQQSNNGQDLLDDDIPF